jgi:transaldolase
MPQSTLDALIDHGTFGGDSITPFFGESHKIIDSLQSLGISLEEITDQLERDGVRKFQEAWEALLLDVEKVMKA